MCAANYYEIIAAVVSMQITFGYFFYVLLILVNVNAGSLAPTPQEGTGKCHDTRDTTGEKVSFCPWTALPSSTTQCDITALCNDLQSSSPYNRQYKSPAARTGHLNDANFITPLL